MASGPEPVCLLSVPPSPSILTLHPDEKLTLGLLFLEESSLKFPKYFLLYPDSLVFRPFWGLSTAYPLILRNDRNVLHVKGRGQFIHRRGKREEHKCER